MGILGLLCQAHGVKPVTASPELAAKRLFETPVRTTVSWPSGETTTRVIDWADRQSVRKFGALANRALGAGGASRCEAVL